jgi:hypothetical protein
MRRLLLTSVLVAGMQGGAIAAPLLGQTTIMGVPPYTQGVEVELGLGETPIRLGGQFVYLRGGSWTTPWTPFTPHSGSRHHVNAWLHYGHRLTEEASIGLIGGMQQAWEPVKTVWAPASRQVSSGLLGVTYERSWEAWHLRLRPTLLVNPQDWTGIPWYGVLAKSAVLSGIPWVELGYRLAPWSELSVRTSITPLAFTLTF